MSTTITTYVTTANYSTRLAEKANAVAAYANSILNTISDLPGLISNAGPAFSNAALAAANAEIALDISTFANTLASIAYANALSANTTLNYIEPIIEGLQSNVTILQPIVDQIQSNVNIILGLESNILTIQTITNTANASANTANLTATNAYTLSVLANTIATIANTNANFANAIIPNLVPIVSGLQSNVSNLQIITSNAFANASVAIITANTANATANFAFATANIANSVAISANSLIQFLNLQSQYIQAVYANVLNTGFNPLWSNGLNGNIYTFSNVKIGSSGANDGNILSVIGNVYISGNLNVVGGVTFSTIPYATAYFPPNNGIIVPYANTSKNEFILNFKNWTELGSVYVKDSNSITFTNPGLYNVNLNIQATSSDGEMDSLGVVNVYTSTNNTLTNATLVSTYYTYTTFGPQTQTLTVPLSIPKTTNSYIFACTFFRNNYPYTITKQSFVEILPLGQIGIPVFPSVSGPFFTDSSNSKVGINNSIPLYSLDVNGDINTTGSIRNNGFLNWTAQQDQVYYTNNVNTTSGFLTASGNISTSQFLNGNVYFCSGLPFNYTSNGMYTYNKISIGTDHISNEFTVVGNIYATQYLYGNASQLTGLYLPWKQGSGTGNSYISNDITVQNNVYANYLFGDISQATGLPTITQFWSNINNFIHVTAPRTVGIGTSTPISGNSLVVVGNVSVSQFVYGNISRATGLYLPWTRGTGTNNAFTTGNVFVNGNLTVSGKIRNEQVFMIACSDETSTLVERSNIATFRVPSSWQLTRPPRATLFSPPSSFNLNVMIYNDMSPLLSSNLYIGPGEYSTRSQTVNPPSLLNTTLAEDSVVNISLLKSDAQASGLKVIFYYVNI